MNISKHLYQLVFHSFAILTYIHDRNKKLMVTLMKNTSENLEISDTMRVKRFRTGYRASVH